MNLTLRIGGLRVRVSDDQHWLTEPRVQGGPEAGQWTSGGGGGSWGKGAKVFSGEPGGEPPTKGSEPGNEPPLAHKTAASEREALGHGYSREATVTNGVIHTSNVYDAARALYEGRKVELHHVREVSTLIKHLGKVAAEMIRMGKKAPTFNLCDVAVEGTNLFCAESKGIPRIKMPQMDNEQTKAFITSLQKEGYKVEQTTEESDHLRATQDELNGAKVAAIAAHYDPEKGGRTIVSRDNYILDGHHRWAAQIGLDAIDDKFSNVTKITRIDISITDLLRKADEFTGGKGHEGMEAPLNVRPLKQGPHKPRSHKPKGTPPPDDEHQPKPVLTPEEAHAFSDQVTEKLSKYRMEGAGSVNINPIFQPQLIDHLEKLAKECPLTVGMRVTTDALKDMPPEEIKSAYAAATMIEKDGKPETVMWMNPSFYANPKYMHDSVMEDAVHEFHDHITDPIGIVTHEYGHQLFNTMRMSLDPHTKIKTRDMGDTTIMEATYRMVDLYKAAKLLAGNGIGSGARALAPSGYALTNEDEWFAESFSVARHGDDEFKNRETCRIVADIVAGTSKDMGAIRDGKKAANEMTPLLRDELVTWETRMQRTQTARVLKIIESIRDKVGEGARDKFDTVVAGLRQFVEEGQEAA